LTNYKDGIVEEREALRQDIETHAKDILDRASEYAEDIRLEKVGLELKQLAEGAMRGKGSLTLVSKEKRAEKPEGEGRAIEKGSRSRNRDEGERATSTGISFRFQALGHDVLDAVEIAGKSVVITFNKTCPKLDYMTRQPQYPGLFLMVGRALARKCMELDRVEIERLFKPMLGSALGSEDKIKMANALEVWWGFAGEEEKTEADAKQATGTN